MAHGYLRGHSRANGGTAGESSQQSGTLLIGTFGPQTRVHSGTFGYIRVHSGTFGYIRGRLGYLGTVRPSCLHAVFVMQKPRFWSQADDSVHLQGAGSGGSFGATTYPFYNIRKEKSASGGGLGERDGEARRVRGL